MILNHHIFIPSSDSSRITNITLLCGLILEQKHKILGCNSVTLNTSTSIPCFQLLLLLSFLGTVYCSQDIYFSKLNFMIHVECSAFLFNVCIYDILQPFIFIFSLFLNLLVPPIYSFLGEFGIL